MKTFTAFSGSLQSGGLITHSGHSARSGSAPATGAGASVVRAAASDGAPAIDIAQRLARKAMEGVPQASQYLEAINADAARVESIAQAARTLQTQSERVPAFDAAGVSAALQTIAFALEQGEAFTERLKMQLPSLKSLTDVSLDRFAGAAARLREPLGQLAQEASAVQQRLASLAEDMGSRNQRIVERGQGAAAVESLTSALQSQAKKGLASVALPPEGRTQVSSLLADLGLRERSQSAMTTGSRTTWPD